MNFHRVGAVVAASMRMFLRDRPAFFFTFAFPIMFIVLFGLIFGGGGTSRPTVDVVGTGPLRQALENSGAIKVKAQPDVERALKRVSDGDEPAAVILHGKQARLVYSKTSQAEAPIVMGIVRGVVDDFNLRAVHASPTMTLVSVPVEAESIDYVDLLVPGLLAMAIAQSAAFGVAFSLVAWRQKGMLRRLRLTPLPLREFATARVIFHLTIALVQAVILLTVGRIFFGVHLVGNALALVPLILVGGVTFIALGMCIGGRVNTEDATAALSNLIVLPMTFLGGVFFPLDAAPAPIQRHRALPAADLPRAGAAGRGRARSLLRLDAARARRARALRGGVLGARAAPVQLADDDVGSIWSRSRSADCPVGVTSSALPDAIRRTQPLSWKRVQIAAPAAPARCGRRSVQSMQVRVNGRRPRPSPSTSMRRALSSQSLPAVVSVQPPL